MSPRDEEFFVGYLPTPLGERRFLARLVVAAFMLIVVAAVFVAAKQRDPGGGAWDLDHETSVQGVLFVRPYPMIVAERMSMLLVGKGKVGADVTGLDRKRVRALGHVLERDGRAMLELVAMPTVVGGSGEARTISNRRAVVLRGEIIDPKCYSGAMKPGEDKTHKGCAALCLRGGIPPMFLAESGEVLLVTDERGEGLNGDRLEQAVALVGELVDVRGERAERGDISVLMVSPDAFRRVRP